MDENGYDEKDYPAGVIQGVMEVSNLLLSETDLETTLDHVATVGCRVLPGCDGAGISVATPDGRTQTFGRSDDWVLEIDQSQYDTGQGPCLEAIRTNEHFEITDLQGDDRWPEFKTRALAHGLRSSYSIPLQVRDKTIGALNLYSKSEEVFSADGKRAADVVASQGAIALANAQTLEATQRLVDQLQESIKTREMIGTAIGLIMEREDISERDAFEMLKNASQHTNTKLREVAQLIIEHKELKNST